MAYSSTNPPQLISQQLGATPARPDTWTYASTDPVGTVVGADYISDGQKHGMKLGDVMFSHDTTNTSVALLYVSALSTSSNAVTLVGGTLVST
jgi:hypothetical protein